MVRCLAVLAVSAVSLSAMAAARAADPAQVRIYKVQGNFANVKDNVANAIAKRGFVIDYTAHIGAMLDRTAKDVGATKKIYAAAEAVQFCSATVSRRTMEADPANIVFCPYVIAIYALAADPKTIYVAYRRPHGAGQRTLAEVDALLDGIVREALSLKR